MLWFLVGATMPVLPQQQDLMMFPLKAVNEFPPRIASADSAGEVEAIDNLRYHVKGDQGGKAICASEWLCTKIAEEVWIAGPPPALIEMLDGTLLFGSRRIAGVADIAVTTNFLVTPSQSNFEPPIFGLRRVLSTIYTFDMFINNVDRHLENYLSTEDSGTRRLYAFDYSRALFWAWPFVGFPGPGENTRKCGALLRQRHGFDQTAALATLDQLMGLAPAVIEGFINRMPQSWMAPELRASFLEWWAGDGRKVRVNDLRVGLENGQLL